MSKSRIYAVKINTPEPTVRLVRASNIIGAIKFVTGSLVHAELATQETIVDLVTAGVKVEEAA